MRFIIGEGHTAAFQVFCRHGDFFR